MMPALLLALLASPTAGQPPEREEKLVVYGEDACPEAAGEEIVVCARRPEAERFRIPKQLRDREKVPGAQSWGSRVATLEDLQRDTRPNGCSPNGSFGQTGCLAEALRRWFEERREGDGVP